MSQSKDHILDNFAAVIIDTALICQAVLPAWLYSFDHSAVAKASYVHLQGFYEGKDFKFCISHFVIFAKSVMVIHSLQLENIINQWAIQCDEQKSTQQEISD